ncbi:hypothetical protein ACIQYS_17490 [Psychrobacillus sp. NPDC096426]
MPIKYKLAVGYKEYPFSRSNKKELSDGDVAVKNPLAASNLQMKKERYFI